MSPERTEHRKLAAIMFTDMVGYSALAQRNESLALELLEEHRRLLREFFPKFGGREVETTGDGFLVEFASALEAARCAIEFQRALATRNLSVTPERHLHVRIGIHVGDVVYKDGHVLGDGVNIAARLQPLAEPGGICISVDVERQIRNTIEASLVKLGPTELKNIQVPMELFRIVLPWEKQSDGSSRREEAHSERGTRNAEGGTITQSLLTSAATGSFRTVALWVLGVALVVGIGWWFVHQFGKGPKQVGVEEEKSIAVLPFLNLSSDKENEYFSDGITEDIITALSKISGLEVKARTSSFAFKGKNDDIQKIGEQLHARFVLEGSVRKAGDKLRITAQLINAATRNHLWSDVYDREWKVKDIIEIQSEVAQRVASALRVALLAGEKEQLAKKPTESLEAYEFYLLGRQQWNKRTEAGFKRAIEYFKRAIDKDPRYALAYVGLADSYALLGRAHYGTLPPKEAFPEAKRAAQEALKLDERLAEAHTSLAFVHQFWDWDWEGAGKEFLRALELNPNYPTALSWYGLYLDMMGRFEESLLTINRAKELDPLAVGVNLGVVWHFYYARNYDQSIKQCQKMIDSDSSLDVTHWHLGRAYVQKAMYQDAITEFQKAITLSGGKARFRAALGHALAVSGKRAEAQQILDDFKQLSKQQYVSADSIAFIYIGLGEKDQAFASLDQAVAEHSEMLVFLKVEPLFNSLRSDPRFTALLKKVGLAK